MKTRFNVGDKVWVFRPVESHVILENLEIKALRVTLGDRKFFINPMLRAKEDIEESVERVSYGVYYYMDKYNRYPEIAVYKTQEEAISSIAITE